MIVYVCTDDRNGMMFNNRRQSRDREVVNDMISSAETPIYINQYSEILFRGTGADYIISESCLEAAGHGDVCFVENETLNPFLYKIEKIVLYKWNRKYPADFFFDIDLSAEEFRQISTREFAGYSHEVITKEVWEREK